MTNHHPPQLHFIMWRTILLGKMSISILASLVVGGICFMYPARNELGIAESAQWRGLGVFFLLLGIGQIAAIYFMMRRKK